MGSVLSLRTLRTAAADQIRTHIGQHVNVRAYAISDPPLPCVQLWAGSPYVNYFATMGDEGTGDVNLIAEVRVPRGTGSSGAEELDLFLALGSDRSVVDAVFADRTLGGAVSDCVALIADEAAEVAGQGDPYVRAFIPLRILVKKEAAA
jgi:hypothetical protein